MKQAYTVLSKLYDKLMTDFDYNSYYQFVSKYIKGNVIELACGSGMFTKQYADRIEKTVALDSCREMLNIATRNNYKNRKYIDFIQANMLKFIPNTNADTVLCVCDGFNYVSGNDLDKLLNKIYGYMNVGAYMIFDISSEYKLRQIIGNNIFYDDSDDYTYLWTNALSNDNISMDITLFSRDGDKYTREDENHKQFIHNREDILNYLLKLNFEVAIYDGEDFGTDKETSKRLLFICCKR